MYAPPFPPEPVAAIVPSFPPKHETFVEANVAVTGVGSVIVMLSVAVQRLASVAVTVYVPAVNPVAVAVVAPFDHK